MAARGKDSPIKSFLAEASKDDRIDGMGEKYHDRGVSRLCSNGDCNKYQKLKACSQCKLVSYCSVECQKQNWRKHKPVCNLNAKDYVLTNGEPHFRRHLRHWAERFAVSLAVACTNGLNLQLEWDRIGDRGLVLVLEPRAHRNIGSRWRICSGGIFDNADIYGMLDGIGQLTWFEEEILPMHLENRSELQASSAGEADFAAVFVLAKNVGPDVLEGEHALVFQFIPVNVYKKAAAVMGACNGDWFQDLKDRVLEDCPLRLATPRAL
ncbi:hypothetical protein GGX14DRAFT_564454 [Mycena pura]|uniref:MYND-type domain-containing protein n=1 Tax=Mycena pura TaxID=153505 RepID=A0AAD6VL45_9AGAR|nr:hypothetical protein GGX14DRAFT_564454 [Mycena pura]